MAKSAQTVDEKGVVSAPLCAKSAETYENKRDADPASEAADFADFADKTITPGSKQPPGGLGCVASKGLANGDLGSVASRGLRSEILASVTGTGVSEERSFASLRSLRTRILVGCSLRSEILGSVANKELSVQPGLSAPKAS